MVLVTKTMSMDVDQLGCELPIRSGDGKQLQAGDLFRRATFVDVDVR